MSLPTTEAYAYDPHGNLVQSHPVGASNDVIHVGSSDKRLVNSSGQAMRGGPPAPPVTSSQTKCLTADLDFSVLATNKGESVFPTIAVSKNPPAEDTPPQVLI